jgi:hypothetical protein
VRLNKVDSDVTRLSVRVESFTQKLSTPGTKFLVNLEYRLVYDTVVTVPNITATFGAVFETLPGALHAVYVISAFATTNLTVQVLTDGPIIVGPGSLCTVAIARQQKAAPTRIESTIIYYQNTGAPLDVSVRVWRRLGMGS